MASKTLPLIVILGTTASGKSKLAIDLARRFGGEIISADSMQVYKGLDIATNKVTDEEQSQAKHHMISFVNLQKKFSVVDFRNRALGIIDSLFQRSLLPIVVGGTHYYIESVLWNNFVLGSPRSQDIQNESTSITSEEIASGEKTLLDSEINRYQNLEPNMRHTEKDFENIAEFFKKPIMHNSFVLFPSAKLWNILDQVDPEAAASVHPNNKRRVVRSLQIIQDQRKNYSDILRTLNKVEDNASLGGPLRYNPTCVFWLHCDEERLIKIVDERVDQMLNRGLISELEGFHEEYEKLRATHPTVNQFEKGILQTIGFKEFHDYLSLNETEKATENGNEILRRSIKDLKESTTRYSKRQMRWITRRLVMAKDRRELPTVFRLETVTNDDDWEIKVKQVAFDIVDCYCQEKPLTKELSKFVVEELEVPTHGHYAPGKLFCEACDRTFIGNHNIEAHLESRSHKRKVQMMKKRARHSENAAAGCDVAN